MNWRGVEARDRGSGSPAPSAHRPRRAGEGRWLPLLAVGVGLSVVVGAALAAPWQAAPPGPVQLPPPEMTPPPPQEIGELTPSETAEPDGGFPLMLLLTILALLVLFFALRAFLNRVTLARGRTEDAFEAAPGRIGQVEELSAEPDLPALRRGVDAARRVLAGHSAADDAIIAAWLELEKAAASSGVDRAPSDTPTEFTTAVLDATRADPAATRTLLGLYHRARFAPHAVLGPAEVALAVRSLERIAESWEER